MTREQETEKLIQQAQEEAGGEPSQLLLAMLGLSEDLHRQRGRERLFRLFVVVVIGALLYLGVGNRWTTDDIITTRTQSRHGLCDAIQAQTDALAKATHADEPTLTAYVGDLNRGLAAIGCVITVNVSGG